MPKTPKTLDDATIAAILASRPYPLQGDNGEAWTDLDTRNSDSADFADISRSELKALLETAFAAGRESA